ncbi:MAG: AAA family ATPase [Bullifex sp.]
MGIYVNPGKKRLILDRNSELYVDKSMLIAELNRRVNTKDRFICTSRPRRFGKTMAADMLCAYFSGECDSHDAFSGLKIERDPSFESNLNKYTVIAMDVNDAVTCKGRMTVPEYFDSEIIPELRKAFPMVFLDDALSLPLAIKRIYAETQEMFVLIIDEYDVVIRDQRFSGELTDYMDMLISLFKNSSVNQAVALAYLTGILPVIKEKAESKLNDFSEFTMLDAENLARFMGFTEEEVVTLATSNSMDVEQLRMWYDGYSVNGMEIYSPKSIITAVTKKRCDDFWSQTSSMDALRDYVMLNYDGLKEDIISMMAGSRINVNVSKFRNSPMDIRSKDEVFTYLIHLGYLAYDMEKREVYIPNHEIRNEWVNSVDDCPEYSSVIKVVRHSKELLEATWAMDTEKVAEAVKETHMTVTSNLTFNNEGSFQSAIRLAYFYADTCYTIVNELPAGKGYADVAFIPRKSGIPAMIVELKRDDYPVSGMKQIREKEYPRALSAYSRNMLLVSVCYSTDTKEHTCIIERA